MRLVVIESPFRGSNQESYDDKIEVDVNRSYAAECMRDCIKRGEAPFASHLIYTQVLNDSKQDERLLGMQMGFAWGAKADAVVVYTDHGVSSGMEAGIVRAKEANQVIEYRTLKGTKE